MENLCSYLVRNTLLQNLSHKFIIRLKEALKSEYVQVRVRAAMALNSLGDKSGVDVMIEDVEVEDPNDRADVVAALRIMKDERAIPALIKASGDRSSYVRCLALSALGEMRAAEAYEVIV